MSELLGLRTSEASNAILVRQDFTSLRHNALRDVLWEPRPGAG
jgi:hypothetical protein